MKVSEQEVTLKQFMGSDLSVVNAARVSFDKESEWISVIDPGGYEHKELSERDVKLISYLARHNHFTPFTHASATFLIKCPIFVARQIHKHQVGFTVNEVSRRYVDSEPEFYFPTEWRGKPVNAKQGSNGVVTDFNSDITIKQFVEAETRRALINYQDLIDAGVAPEQARMVLPQNTMTEFWMTGSLYAWARLCNLRLDAHAQKETQEIAQMVSAQMKQLFPHSWKALVNDQT